MFLCLSDIQADFKTELAKLIPLLLAPDRLVEKEIAGKKVTCGELVEYFRVLQHLNTSQCFDKHPKHLFCLFLGFLKLKHLCSNHLWGQKAWLSKSSVQ